MKKMFLILILVVLAMGLVAFFQSNVIEDIPVDQDTTKDIIVDEGIVGPPVGILPFDSGVIGKVLLGPACPVMRLGDDNCNDKPYSIVIDVFSVENDDNPFSRVMSDKEGNYKVMLPPGDYVLRPKNEKIFPHCGEQVISIKPSLIEEVNLSCDTGIR